MSFITKRERVFNEYDLFDLPARNEGKLKAYSSCTDARAWSHFCSDKTEHLVDIIKRNNETVRPKYVPTEIIVNTLMISKNAEIARLKRKIEEFEQMLAAYDQLELTCDQKCDIANAHAAIKAANKELDDMCLDLDLSGYTEGIDSEAFETGKSRGDELRYSGEIEKSRGDEWLVRNESTPRMETKSNQFGESCTCDASTSAYDTRIDDLKGTIISKDAKLSAMQNTIAVMENDVCEPYCVYAHIYTALEKIFGTLCQNEKYKEYLDLLTAGKNTKGIDIKGKILFKIKVLEKFSLALIAPCSQEYNASNDCSCYHAEILTQVQTTFALTSSEIKNPQLDSKRAELIADIMQNDDIKEIMNNGSFSTKLEDDQIDECYILDNYNIDDENLKRLKNLQSDYEDLLNCYDNLKHERDCLNIRCQKYVQLEHECECLQNKLREYKQLWKEKEYYRNRSEDLDALKENYLVLADETSNVETKLRAEQEISKVKSRTVDELRNENIKLDNKLTEVSLVFEKQKNMLVCKLKEYECKIMCQEQQIKSLSMQIDGFLEKDANKTPIKEESQTLVLFNEIESQKEQINKASFKFLKDALCCNEEEKQYYQEEFENQLQVINQLKLAVEDWKSKYEKALQSNNYLEKYLEDYHVQMGNYQENNRLLNTEIEKKASAIDNLNEIIDSKSQELNHLMDEVDRKKKENEYLVNQIKSIHDDFNKNVQLLENERVIALASIHSAREESIEILESVKHYKDKKNVTDEQNITNKEKEIQLNEIKRIESLIQENKKMHSSNIIEEFELLREINIENINILRCENEEIKKSFELAQKQSEMLNKKILNQDNLMEKLQQLTKSHEILMHERDSLQDELINRTNNVNKVLQDYELTEKKSEALLDELKKYECKYVKLHEAYKKIESERNDLQKEVEHAEAALSKELNRSETIITNLKDTIILKTKEIECQKRSLFELSKKLDSLQEQNQVLQRNFDEKCKELKELGDILEKNVEENRILNSNNNTLKIREMTAHKNIEELKKEKSSMQVNLDIIKKESSDRLDKLQHYKNIQNQFNDLMIAHHKIDSEKTILQNNLHTQLQEFKKLQQENYDLNNQNKTLISLNEELEKSLIRTREQAILHTDKNISYTNVKLEIDKLKAEKVTCNNKINQLQDKLDESEYYINNLNEDILVRDKKITTLENHINSLEDEIRKLQFNLDEVVQSGEEIKNLSFEKIDQSRNLLEAHYSKARHNLKMDLVKLQNEKCKLEEQLSKSELLSHASCQEKQSFINRLQQEREQIISEIKQLEINIFKESKLNPKCTFIEILHTLEKIGKFLDVKNTSLEKTLLNVQDSYQILKSKAEEAKNIAEKERQKIIDEKEEMYKERKMIEDQLLELRNKVEEDKVMYENVINDLNGEISNQNLIFDKIKQNKENEICKLKEEKLSLQDLNEKLLITQKDLEEKLYKQRNENKNIQNLIEKVSFDLKNKNMEILSLQKTMDDFKNKSSQELGIQVILGGKQKEVSTETDVTEKKLIDKSINVYSCEIISDLKDSSDLLKPNNGLHNLNIPELLLDKENIESSIDLLKCIYINYKIKRLRIGRLEQYSIMGIKIVPDNNEHVFQNDSSHKKYCIKSPTFKKSTINSLHTNESIVSIYNTKILTDSTRNTYEIDNHISSAKTESMKSSAITELALTNEILETDNDSKNNIEGNESPISTDKDLFLIYEDSQTNSIHTQKPWSTNGYANIIVERATVHTNQKNQIYEQNKFITTNNIKEHKYYKENIDEPSEDDSIKPKLNVNLPRVLTDTFSTTTMSDDEKISTDTYMRAIYATPRRKVFSDTNISVKNHKNNQFNVPSTLDNPDNDEHESNNKFVNDANSAISVLPEVSLKSLNKIQEPYKDTNTGKKLSKLTRTNAKTQILKYKEKKVFNERGINEDKDLTSTVKYNDSNINKNVDLINFFSKTNSENKLNSEDKLKTKISKESSSLQKSNSSHHISTEYSSISFSPRQIKSAIDRAISVQLDIVEDYEKKILQLTQALENTEKDYKNKMEAIKIQYDCNVKRIINEHNQGVESIQSLHEEKLCDIIKIHDNEIENLRAMSIEALRKVEKLENENHYLKSKLAKYEFNFDEIPVKIPTPDLKRKKGKCKLDDKTLTKTNVAVLDVKPKRRSHGPCTCSIDINVSDTIRNIFDQVDIEQRKMAEQTYLKYIANKILSENVEVLDAEELSFLHLKVCRTWKTRLNKEETLQKRIDSLECELINKQRQTHKHMAELDRKVAQEWKRLQEVREAVCCSPHNSDNYLVKPAYNQSTTNIDINTVIEEKLPASELESEHPCICGTKRIKASNRAVLAKLDAEGKKEKCHYNDETPIRLKRSHEHRAHKK